MRAGSTLAPLNPKIETAAQPLTLARPISSTRLTSGALNWWSTNCRLMFLSPGVLPSLPNNAPHGEGQSDAIRAGGLAASILPTIFPQPHDIPMSLVVTEEGIREPG